MSRLAIEKFSIPGLFDALDSNGADRFAAHLTRFLQEGLKTLTEDKSGFILNILLLFVGIVSDCLLEFSKYT